MPKGNVGNMTVVAIAVVIVILLATVLGYKAYQNMGGATPGNFGTNQITSNTTSQFDADTQNVDQSLDALDKDLANADKGLNDQPADLTP